MRGGLSPPVGADTVRFFVFFSSLPWLASSCKGARVVAPLEWQQADERIVAISPPQSS